MAKPVRKNISGKLRFSVLRRDRFRCVYCGASGAQVKLQIDHVVPVAAGGDNSYWNLLTACFDCNNAKRAQPARFDVPSYREELRRKNITEFFPKISREAMVPEHQGAWKCGHETDALIEGRFLDPETTARFLHEFAFIPDPYEVKPDEWLEIYFPFMQWVVQTFLDKWKAAFPGKNYGDQVTEADRAPPATAGQN